MPLAMTCRVRSLTEIPPEPIPERLFKGFLSHLLGTAGISDECFQQTRYPFTVSRPMTVERGRPREGANPDRARKRPCTAKGARFLLRVTWLDDSQLAAFHNWVSSLPARLGRLEADSPFLVEDAWISTTAAEVWSRSIPYPRLYEEASDSVRDLTLKFCSPTVLLRQGIHHPLPDPCPIFLGYLSLWDTYSGIGLPEGLRQAIERGLAVVNYRLRRVQTTLGRGPVPGFVGSATFRTEGRWPESMLKGLNTLADYSFFCGTGMGTGMGLGMTRRIWRSRCEV
jgi:CRISPR-associated endoribonuclease Cas6